jgi:hypothetical protein
LPDVPETAGKKAGPHLSSSVRENRTLTHPFLAVAAKISERHDELRKSSKASFNEIFIFFSARARCFYVKLNMKGET